jgi:hypothetical protein
MFLILSSIGYFVQCNLIKEDISKSKSLYSNISDDYIENIFNYLEDNQCYLIERESVNSFRDSIIKSKVVANDLRIDSNSKSYIKKLYYLICELDIKYDKRYSLKKFENKIKKYDFEFIKEKNKKLMKKPLLI